MKKFIYLDLIIALILFFALPNNSFANYKESGKDNGKKPRLQKTLVNPSQSLININGATMWITEEGFHDWVVASGWNGAYPNGQPVGAIFSEGIVWGGQVSDGASPVVRVNGNTYGTGCAPITRLYRVRPDYLTGNLTSDAATFNDIPIGAVTAADIQSIKDQYAVDWNEWPANAGAPFKDVNNNGTYEPETDIPGIPGASQTLFVKYNDNLSTSNYGSPPIGMEVSETYWAYSYSGALGNVIYKKVDMVYKGTPTSASNSKIDSMYIVQWSDPDVGTSSDDFAGCDTSLNLGYAYNSAAEDGTYQGLGFKPPAAGFDFLQGVSKFTGNPNDSAIFNLQWRKGYKYVNSKPMSSFIYFAAGGAWGDPGFNYNGTLEFYNLMRGKRPIPRYPSAQLFPTEVADITAEGTYLLAGDPVAITGKLDGNVEGPGDRRIMVVNGPITMNLGDTAQVVLALVYGMGTDNLTSVAAMKKNDETAQIVFEQLFQLPNIDPPNVSVANLNNKIVLNWGSDISNLNKIETFSDKDYNFEGYEVYQLPSSSSSLSDGILLGTFDAVNGVQAVYDTVLDVNGTAIPVLAADGKDKGLQRYFTINEDKVRGTALRNGQEYYFAVVSYAYNPAPLLPFHVLRSAFVIQTTVPQTTFPGVRLSSSVGDTVSTVHFAGTSDGSVTTIVVDPTGTTGDSYEVSFDTLAGSYVWTLTDVTKNKVLLSNQTNQSGDNDYTIVDGLIVKVIGPPVAINNYSATGTRWLSGHDWGGAQFFGGMDLGANFFGSDVQVSDYVPIEMRWTGGPDVPSEANGWSQGAVYRRDLGYAYDNIGWMPFTVWDVSDPNNAVQINATFVEDANNGVANLKWDMGWDGTSFAADGGREYIFINNTPYDPNYYNGTVDGTFNDVLYAIWPQARGTHPYLEDTFVLDIVPNYANTETDIFTFTAPAALSSNSTRAIEDVKKINVFPNPYYGFHSRETSPGNKYVTFSHLPDNAVIRIFDISGVLVKTINHLPTNGQFDVWDLQNDNDYPVASGIYIVYVDMPGLGTTKILKLAVIQEQQILRVY